MRMKRVAAAGGVLALALGFLSPHASAESGQDVGGWDEVAGSFAVNQNSAGSSGLIAPMASGANHRGEAETKTINGTTNKRAKGWTTWVGQYHYTRARMESDAAFGSNKGKIWTDSGRQWGTNGTSAVSPWKAFNPDNPGTPGKARTYYGR